ncbi:MAG: ATP-binding cassette domain-containing protein [Lachnospiraceae bacterium]|nr:ATP-binding cassette domain-containing protein [Lachnospiraceae bacterium]
MSKQTAIQVSSVTKSFGENEVIKDCSMCIERGTIYGFLGANGAGKTTVFKLLTGLLTPDSGGIEILGFNMLQNCDKMLSQIGSLIEAPTFYEHLSAHKNLEIHLEYMGVDGFGVDKALKIVGLSDTKEKAASKFSLGMRQRLGIARALIHQPKILILDEPINGLDPMGIRAMRELFLSLAKEHGITILLSSHILSEIEHVADKIGVIVAGKIVCETDLAQVKAEYKNSLEDYFFTIMSEGKQL